jgi:hypothetical protein
MNCNAGKPFLRAPRRRASAQVCFLLTIDYMEVRMCLPILLSLADRPDVAD